MIQLFSNAHTLFRSICVFFFRPANMKTRDKGGRICIRFGLIRRRLFALIASHLDIRILD